MNQKYISIYKELRENGLNPHDAMIKAHEIIIGNY